MRRRARTRSYGAPRTLVAAIRPPGCSNASAAAGTEVLGGFGSGGADWAAAAAAAAASAAAAGGVCSQEWLSVVLVPWLSFFEASYQQRDRNLLIFLGMLALIFYIVNMMVHRQLHGVDEAVARRRSNEEKDPDHEEALAQLAEPAPKTSRCERTTAPTTPRSSAQPSSGTASSSPRKCRAPCWCRTRRFRPRASRGWRSDARWRRRRAGGCRSAGPSTGTSSGGRSRITVRRSGGRCTGGTSWRSTSFGTRSSTATS